MPVPDNDIRHELLDVRVVGALDTAAVVDPGDPTYLRT